MLNTDQNSPLAQKVKKLHDKYWATLPDKYNEIVHAWCDLRANSQDPTFYELFYRLIHTLKGTSATFGFTTQADICFNIQQILLRYKNLDKPLSKDDLYDIEDCLTTLEEKLGTPAEYLPY